MGVVIKGVDVLQSTRRIDTVVFDKTGTITTGVMQMLDIVCVDGVDRADALRLIGAVEHASEHPIAKAIARAAQNELGALPAVSNFNALAGMGARGVVDGVTVVVGQERLLKGELILVPATLRQAMADARAFGNTAVVAAWGGQARAVCVVADQPKTTSREAIGTLREMGMAPVLLTGDTQATAEAVAALIGIDSDEYHVRGGLLPAEKVAVIREIQDRGYAVAMVGDGVNDAAALAQADVGIAMGTGTDVAMQASDLTIVSGDLRLVADSIALSRATLRTISANVFWAFAYNAAAIPLAASGRLNPMWAGLAMACSSVFVVLNSLRLRRVKLRHR
jgi:Cu+-exporting ATPase